MINKKQKLKIYAFFIAVFSFASAWSIADLVNELLGSFFLIIVLVIMTFNIMCKLIETMIDSLLFIDGKKK